MSHTPLPPPGELARLLDTERRLEERLRQARAEAEALVVRAREDGAAREAALAAELAALERRLDEALEAERRQREAELAAAAERDAAAYAAVPAARLAAVARVLAERLVVGAEAAQ